MTTDHRSIELEILARLQTQISDSLGRLYDASRSKDFIICNELGQAMTNSDKLIFVYRAIAKMCEAGTPKTFSDQEKILLDQLERSRTLLESRGNVIPFDPPQATVDSAVRHLIDPYDGSEDQL